MYLFQEKHTDSGLPDAAANGIGKPALQYILLERQLFPLCASCLYQLLLQRLLIHTDAHGRQLQCNIQRFIVDDDIPVQRPVVIIRSAAVMRFAGSQSVSDLHQEHSTILLRSKTFPLPRRLIRITVFQLLRSEKSNLRGQEFFDIRVLHRHIILCLLQ